MGTADWGIITLMMAHPNQHLHVFLTARVIKSKWLWVSGGLAQDPLGDGDVLVEVLHAALLREVRHRVALAS